MKKIALVVTLLAVGSVLLFGYFKPTKPNIETRVVYTEDAQEVMIGMMMSGRYNSVLVTNDNGKCTITATLK